MFEIIMLILNHNAPDSVVRQGVDGWVEAAHLHADVVQAAVVDALWVEVRVQVDGRTIRGTRTAVDVGRTNRGYMMSHHDGTGWKTVA